VLVVDLRRLLAYNIKQQGMSLGVPPKSLSVPSARRTLGVPLISRPRRHAGCVLSMEQNRPANRLCSDLAINCVEGFRARRSSAEQDNLGDRPMRSDRSQKGGMPMVKNVRNRAGVLLDTTLVAVGWVAFLLGTLGRAQYPMYALCLSAVARVLP
jgi:hypothetical protein